MNKVIMLCMGFTWFMVTGEKSQNNEVVTDRDGNIYHVVTIGGQDWTGLDWINLAPAAVPAIRPK